MRRIELHGGEAVVDNYPSERLNLDNINYIITTTTDFPDYYDALDRMLQILKPTWVDVSIATRRLAHPRKHSPDPRLFLSDVVATCADLPESDAEAIAGGILAMGGNYSSKLTSQVTHIIALSMEAETVENARARNMPCLIVLPHWIDDCLRLGKKIDATPYTLPDPEVQGAPATRAPQGKYNEHVVDATHPDPGDLLPDGPHRDDKGKALRVFENKKVLLDRDLEISQYLRGVLTTIVADNRGQVVDQIEEANMLICKHRDGTNFTAGLQRRIDVGNLAWLYYLIVHDIWTSPFRRLLHFPVSRQPLKGFEGLKISLSNYSGEARTYLENLIRATGAECTKTLKQENTHLITAHTQSEKVAAARDWSINVVNHLWLEDSYVKWKMQSVTNTRYTHFPKKTNLGEVVGQTQIDREVVERQFLPKELHDSTSSKIGRRSVSSAKALASPAKDNRQDSRDVPSAARPDGPKTPAHPRFAPIGKENATPTTAGSRKSKDAAAAKLHDMTADIALYEKERKRVGGVTHGRSREDREDRSAPASSRKRSAESDDERSSDPDTSFVKRQRIGPAPIEMHLLISGYRRWIGHAKDETADHKKLRELGIVVTTDPSRATHLAVPSIVRTAKFVCALAYAPMIISSDFIDACLEQEELPDPRKFVLKDAASEKRYGVSLATSLRRARENQQRLLRGHHIFCVERIHGGLETYQAIVEANGGQCTPYRGRHTTIPSTRAGSDAAGVHDAPEEVYLISGDSAEDKKVWSRFVRMAEGNRRTPRIVQPDWLLDTAMCQAIQPVAKYELKL